MTVGTAVCIFYRPDFIFSLWQAAFLVLKPLRKLQYKRAGKRHVKGRWSLARAELCQFGSSPEGADAALVKSFSSRTG